MTTSESAAGRVPGKEDGRGGGQGQRGAAAVFPGFAPLAISLPARPHSVRCAFERFPHRVQVQPSVDRRESGVAVAEGLSPGPPENTAATIRS